MPDNPTTNSAEAWRVERARGGDSTAAGVLTEVNEMPEQPPTPDAVDEAREQEAEHFLSRLVAHCSADEVELVAVVLRAAKRRGAEAEREACAMKAAEVVALDGRIFYNMSSSYAKRLADRAADAIRARAALKEMG